MAKRNQAKPTESDDSIDTKLSEHLLKALTQQEIAQLIDALFGVLSSELQEQAIDQLFSSTQQTVRQILTTTIPQDSNKQAKATPIASIAKQVQTWSSLWGEWNTVLSEVSEDEGKYSNPK
jgi:NAD(P)H-hydrate repair Nnr-like enzyme with NAD(P)H-hydrate epimerase domain